MKGRKEEENNKFTRTIARSRVEDPLTYLELQYTYKVYLYGYVYFKRVGGGKHWRKSIQPAGSRSLTCFALKFFFFFSRFTGSRRANKQQINSNTYTNPWKKERGRGLKWKIVGIPFKSYFQSRIISQGNNRTKMAWPSSVNVTRVRNKQKKNSRFGFEFIWWIVSQ
jgi:hypothetical protein